MLVKTTITEKKEISKEITLPYYSKSFDTFYRINKDESVLNVFVNSAYASMNVSKKTSWSEAMHFSQAIEAQECSREEVEDAVKRYLEFVGQTVENLSEAI